MAVRETEVLAANAAFYAAMRRGDRGAMAALWSVRFEVSCTHPGGPTLTGRAAVIGSWDAVLAESPGPEIRVSGPVAVVSGRTALVLCEERIAGARLIAVNAFMLEDEAGDGGAPGGWRMIGHHAADPI
ncbi:nuclear transport factor 2 family protein [Paralimibaculum aggregatum]|nr:nuclear transport factor 2 family protein [Limibaculum sp. NKW23]